MSILPRGRVGNCRRVSNRAGIVSAYRLNTYTMDAVFVSLSSGAPTIMLTG